MDEVLEGFDEMLEEVVEVEEVVTADVNEVESLATEILSTSVSLFPVLRSKVNLRLSGLAAKAISKIATKIPPSLTS